MEQLQLYDPKQLMTVPPQDLINLAKGIETEIQNFEVAFQSLKQSYDSLLSSQSALEPMKKEEKGTPLFVPLTSSLYVHGEISNPNVLVDVGSGYFIEQDIKEAQDILARKANYIKVSLDQVSVRVSYQKQNLNSIELVLREQMKSQGTQQQQQIKQ